MQTSQLLILGGGPGGYVAAIRAAQLGIQTVLVENENVGGTCLNVGCIPSKALIHAAEEFHKLARYDTESPLGIQAGSPIVDIVRTTAWKDGIVERLTGGVASLLKKSGVQVVKGWARIVDGKTVEIVSSPAAQPGSGLRISCEHLLLATGSEPVALPSMPFGSQVISSTQALSPGALPTSMAVVGAGYIGMELGMAYRKLGVEVTIVEAQERILPAYDTELSKPVLASLKKLGVSLHLSCSVLGLDDAGHLRIKDAQGAESTLAVEQILVAIGRRPRIAGFGLESLLLDMNGSAVRIDDQCRTSMRGVWAIGDVAGEPMLAHRAMAQGEMVAEIISGKHRRFVPASIPAVCFTDPEIVVSGLSPGEAETAGVDAISASFPFSANGRAMTLESSDGFVRVVARRDNHLILGWQAVGGGVSELSAAFSQSLEMGARLEDVAGTIHAHPSLGEAIQEAAMRALGHALHI
ncbi:dihydrolipoyl dehydrogenase [Pollutimonas nitritireducens]|uniref:Dihydrolipoyl dehydrogenase n=1 Tax=Pollutimonas nitritireducens TaxID=2045209 RepID=A0A2N4UEQ9_9BURK|nr:dihydrolipoyl dehydrogenase [Pollutimonas nitritireducens]PLC53485.1 dihydrolipoyl dehydrogenase [Pollutimonas nitritireducens]